MYIKMGSLRKCKCLTLANIQYSDQFLVVNGALADSPFTQRTGHDR
ncbi:hypothetical protein MASR2M79_06500 [Aminivibrio sp.]